MARSKPVAAFGLSRIVAGDSSVIPEGGIGHLPPEEFDTLKRLGFVREPTADELKAANEAPEEDTALAAVPAPVPPQE